MTDQPQHERPFVPLARAAMSLLGATALAAGVPAVLLVTVANPVPTGWQWDTPVTNEALLGLLAAMAWVFWAQFALCLVVEILAEIRLATGRSSAWLSRLPGTFPAQQALARTMVHAVVAVGLGSAALTSGAASSTSPTEAPVTSQSDQPTEAEAPLPLQASVAVPVDHTLPTVERRGTDPEVIRRVTVTKGDSLWSLAERHLGSGEDWRTIAALNRGRVMTGEQQFRDNVALQPGWTLIVPAKPAARDESVVTVQPGDSLWSMSQTAYGDGDRWNQIYDANSDRIDDPDLIYPGQDLQVPDTKTPRTSPRAPQPEPHRTEPRQGTPPEPPRPIPEPTPHPAGVPTPETTSDTEEPPATPDQHEHADPAENNDVDAATMLRALGGGALLLASGLLTALLTRRRSQFRNRPSGRTIPATPPHLAPTERAIRTHGSTGGAAAHFLDHALRDLAARARRGECELPEVVAARLSETALDLVVTGDPEPPPPWQRESPSKPWRLTRDAPLETTDAMAPYPTLVAIGLDDTDGTWLVDLEAAGIVHITGEDESARNLLRFMAAELATNIWSDDVTVLVDTTAADLVPINPSRLEHTTEADLGQLTKTARRVREAAETTGFDVLAGRADGRGGDTWLPTVLLTHADRHLDTRLQLALPGANDLRDELATTGRSTVALVSAGTHPIPEALVLTINATGRLEIPWSTPLVPNSLTDAEATTLGRIFAAHVDDDAECFGDPMPDANDGTPIAEVTDTAGALRQDLTTPRSTRGESQGSLLPLPDEAYIDAAATTTEDLSALAPAIMRSLADEVVALDPDLDADLEDWRRSDNGHRPRLRVLGPVELTVAGPRPHEVDRRRAYYAELVAYLIFKPAGVTPAQMAEAFDVQTNTLHSRINTLRKWLGNEPSGNWHLPESTMSPASRSRGVPVYQLTGLLCDADLFKRLRTRGQARGEPGVDDLVCALRLVEGRPFDHLRPGGYGWLADSPHDHYLSAAVVDVAHIVATHALGRNDGEQAAWAAGIAITAAPAEDKPRVDLVHALQAMGESEEQTTGLMQRVSNRSDDGAPPPTPSERTKLLLDAATNRDDSARRAGGQS